MLGFRKKNELKEYHQITHPYFIYPDETVRLSLKITKL